MNKNIKILLIVFSIFLIQNIGAFDGFGVKIGEEIKITPNDFNINIHQGNLTNFTDLQDTPGSYAGEGGNCVAVNAGGTALEFVACSAAGDTNETNRFTNLTLTDCPANYYVYGVDVNGTLVCREDQNSGSGGGNTTEEIQAAVNGSIEYDFSANTSRNWDTLDTFNATQMEQSDNVLNILESWLTNFFNTLFGTKTTDDLTEGSTNLYDNQTWNETRGNELYSPIGASDTNASTCNDGEYLDGNGTCVNFDSKAQQWDTNISDTNWSTSDLNTLFNDTQWWNKTYADTLYTAIGASDTNCSDGGCLPIFYWANQSYLNETDLALSINTTANIILLEADPNWAANFTNLQDNCADGNYSYGVYSNGTLKCRSDISGAAANCEGGQCGAIFYWANQSYLNETDLALSINTSANINLLEGDPEWDANFTNMQIDCGVGNYSYGFYPNGTQKCRDDITAVGESIGDGNASSICGNGEYLDGSGSCINFNETVTLLDTNISDTNWSTSDLNTLFNDTELATSINTTSNFQALFNTVISWIMNFTKIYSLDWSNVTITTSQITDYSAITDTNCSEGNCDEVFYWTNQSYLNETDLALSINTTVNVEALGFVQGSHTVDTNETGRFLNLNLTDCPDGNYSYGVYENGTIQCRDDLQGTFTDTNASICNDGEYLDGDGTCKNLADIIVSYDTNISDTNWSTSDLNTLFNDTDLAMSINTTTNLQSLFSSVISWIMNFTKIYSLDWSNVTITTSQITDYAAVTDTNCSEGNCDEVFYWANQSYLNETDKINLLNNTITNSNNTWTSTYNETYTLYNDTLAIQSVNNSAYSQNTTLNLQSLFSSVISWIMNFTKIYSLDWSNVTITTSQITDYAAVTDTNCSDGSCLPVFYWTNQSYLNETDLALSINTTANVEALGFVQGQFTPTNLAWTNQSNEFSSPQNFTDNINITGNNITGIDCLIGTGGGQIC